MELIGVLILFILFNSFIIGCSDNKSYSKKISFAVNDKALFSLLKLIFFNLIEVLFSLSFNIIFASFIIILILLLII